MNLNEVDIHYLIAAISVITSGIGVLHNRSVGRAIAEEVEILASGIFFVGTAGRFCGNGFNGEYCATHTLA